jgi:hypothetical protein
MGYKQKMTDKQRLDWGFRQYEARLAANRGHNYAYMTKELEERLERLGYKKYNSVSNYSELSARKIVEQLRKDGCYARIISHATKLSIREYDVYYRSRISI